MPPHRILCLWTNGPVNTRSRAGPSLAQLWPPGRPWGPSLAGPCSELSVPERCAQGTGQRQFPQVARLPRAGPGARPGHASHARPHQPRPTPGGHTACSRHPRGFLFCTEWRGTGHPGPAPRAGLVLGTEWLCEQLRGDREPHEGGPGPRCPDPPPSTLSPALMTVNCESQACAVTPWTPGIWGRAGVMGHQELPSSYRGLGRDGPVPRAAGAREGRL